MRFEIVVIGNELLNGDLADTNTQRLARLLRSHGLALREAQVVPDLLEPIVSAFRLAASRADVVLVSGGLGPTSDDLTLEAAAAFAGVALETHAETVSRLKARYAARGVVMTPNNLRQAEVPQGAEVFDNPVGTAPHVQLVVAGARGPVRFFFFPGVPNELTRLSSDYLVPWLLSNAPVKRYQSASFRTFGKPESAVAMALDHLPKDPRLHVAYRAHVPEIQVSLHVEDDDPASGRALLDEASAAVRTALSDIIFSEDKDKSLVAVVAEWLVSRGETLALAESCTGGLVGKLCTDLPGSSRFFLEGFVAYANAAKVARLGVDPSLIEAHGAVSEPVAKAMAEGAKRLSGATWALALTGISGPDGGSEQKPVGTVHIALAGPEGTTHLLRRYPFDRERNRMVSAFAALDMLRRALVRKSA
jgi:nicotinamide-nucleotide amidase